METFCAKFPIGTSNSLIVRFSFPGDNEVASEKAPRVRRGSVALFVCPTRLAFSAVCALITGDLSASGAR